MEQGIIKVTQLPIIEENLRKLKEETEKKAELAEQMVCTDDTRKTVKATRADLAKEYKELETMRKQVKEQIEKPYKDFLTVYNECVAEPYKKADKALKDKIDSVERALKDEKKEKVKVYAEELKTAYALSWLKTEVILPNVTLSDSLSKLRQIIADKLERVSLDCKCIAEITDSNESAEVLAEYKKTLNLAQARLTVSQRKREIEEARADAEGTAEQEQVIEEATERVEQVEETLPPPVVEQPEEKQYRMRFTVYGTISQLKELKNFMNERGIQYEQ